MVDAKVDNIGGPANVDSAHSLAHLHMYSLTVAAASLPIISTSSSTTLMQVLYRLTESFSISFTVSDPVLANKPRTL